MAVLKTTSPWPSTAAPSGSPTKARPSSRTSAANLDDDNSVHPVLFGDADLYLLGVGGRHVLADVVGPDRQLAVAAVDQHRELDGPRPPELNQRIHRRPRGAAAVDHVVDEDDDLAVDRRHPGVEVRRGLAQVAVVPVLADVERARRDGVALELLEQSGEALRQVVAARVD